MAHQPIRSDFHIGGKNLSPSYLAAWWKCPRLWFYKYVVPRPDGTGTNTVGKTSKDLILGSAVHAGLEAWYLSGWEDGGYDLDISLSAGIQEIATRDEEFWEQANAQWAKTKTILLLSAYHTKYGPNGTHPEFPETKVLPGPDGLPLVERTFAIPVGSYLLTVRPDLVASVCGYASILEHKTVAASRLSSQVATMKLGGQCLAEYTVLRGADIDVGAVYANFLVKDRGKKSELPELTRETITYSDRAVDRYLRDVHRAIGAMEDALGVWTRLTDQGVDPIIAAEECFPMAGVFSGACVGFGKCSHYDVCASPGRERASLDAFGTANVTETGDPQ